MSGVAHSPAAGSDELHGPFSPPAGLWTTPCPAPASDDPFPEPAETPPGPKCEKSWTLPPEPVADGDLTAQAVVGGVDGWSRPQPPWPCRPRRGACKPNVRSVIWIDAGFSKLPVIPPYQGDHSDGKRRAVTHTRCPIGHLVCRRPLRSPGPGQHPARDGLRSQKRARKSSLSGVSHLESCFISLASRNSARAAPAPHSPSVTLLQELTT